MLSVDVFITVPSELFLLLFFMKGVIPPAHDVFLHFQGMSNDGQSLFTVQCVSELLNLESQITGFLALNLNFLSHCVVFCFKASVCSFNMSYLYLQSSLFRSFRYMSESVLIRMLLCASRTFSSASRCWY